MNTEHYCLHEKASHKGGKPQCAHTHTHPYLFFEVADGKFISKSEEMTDVVLNVVVLQMVHHVSAIALKIHHTFLGKMAGFHLWS